MRILIQFNGNINKQSTHHYLTNFHQDISENKKIIFSSGTKTITVMLVQNCCPKYQAPPQSQLIFKIIMIGVQLGVRYQFTQKC